MGGALFPSRRCGGWTRRPPPSLTRPFSGCPHAVDGNYCLTCGSDKTLKLWNPHKGTALRSYQGHGYEVLDAAG
uniref:Uncharacterized protein n=1 Tax=Phasianus colchicus TaxID=9054 RepID=A0A669QQ82_PHACC